MAMSENTKTAIMEGFFGNFNCSFAQELAFFNWNYFWIAYLLGSIPFGLLLTRYARVGDIRKIGSGNIGATNVMRAGGLKLAALTLLLDVFKVAGLILFLLIIPECGHATAKHILLLVGLCGILGHCFPIWLKFKGGKGVATTIGVLLTAVPWTGLLAAVTWGIVAGFSRISSLSALSAAALVPLFTLIFYGWLPAFITLLITALVFWRHKDNIKRLLAGIEPKIGAGKKKEPDEPTTPAE